MGSVFPAVRAGGGLAAHGTVLRDSWWQLCWGMEKYRPLQTWTQILDPDLKPRLRPQTHTPNATLTHKSRPRPRPHPQTPNLAKAPKSIP